VLAKGKLACFKTTAVLPTHTVKSSKNHGSDIGKKTSTYKVKDPLTFEKCIFRNGQPDCDEHTFQSVLLIVPFPLFVASVCQ